MTKAGKSLLFLLYLCIIGGFIYLFVHWNGIIKNISQGEVEKERRKWEEVVKNLEANIAALKKEAEGKKEVVSQEVSGPEFSLPLGKEEVDCEKVKSRLLNFFGYLDGKEYVINFELKNGSQEHYNQVMAELSQKIPIASETGLDFEALMLNKIHFFRVLGKNNILLVKEILANERGNLETILMEFFEYFKAYDFCPSQEIFVPSPEVRYEYASYFLNTFGGKSYLLRRSSRIRILVTYYAVLTLHEANEKVLNQHGINIQPYLNQIFEEINARNDLIYKNMYLKTLSEIKSKYPFIKSGTE